MPRLQPSLFWRARRISPFATFLLRACRDLQSVKNELRWISEHVSQAAPAFSPRSFPYKTRMWQLCERRARGEPLQYILGTQPFGELDIRCRPGVLIPRWETEAYTLELSRILIDEISSEKKQPMRILDVCSGTGCIALQLYSQLQPSCPSLHVRGLDISQEAISLARENVVHNALVQNPGKQTIRFLHGNIFNPSDAVRDALYLSQQSDDTAKWDLIISNPPYVSNRSFSRDTTRSVRNFEPKLALVPNHTHNDTSEDIFYARLLDLSKTLRPKRMLFEVAGMEQALRVVRMIFLQQPSLSSPAMRTSEKGEAGKELHRDLYTVVQIWRDDPSVQQQHAARESEKDEVVTVEGREITVKGDGKVRSVYFVGGDSFNQFGWSSVTGRG
ncbi:S-adenosyl-L-methionine-dependent methyltransferase [Apodospora peruviana]|uniref:S-adenosyl-L-methionine-dependent methyltransferase n=1 Tax=Apodospora peruviana TaxID=516989 RepID=A0AAE0MAE8_9PEZI|nr:S-adenosyl-L-methionine-dependent methyltransferase [Apodospora peruviana]